MTKLASPATELTRFEPRARQVRLESMHWRADNLVSCWFTGAELHDFVSPAGGDHIKLQVPNASGELVAAQTDLETGRITNRAELGLRDMTPRAIDRDDQRLRIDIVAHAGGVVGQWLNRAQPGDECAIMGPRGSRQVVEPLDRVIAVVDAAALPAAERRLDDFQLPGELHLLGIRDVAALDLPEGVALVEHELERADDWGAVAAEVVARIPADERVLVWGAGEAHGVAQLRGRAGERAREGLFGQFNGYWQVGVAEYDHHADLPTPSN